MSARSSGFRIVLLAVAFPASRPVAFRPPPLGRRLGYRAPASGAGERGRFRPRSQRRVRPRFARGSLLGHRAFGAAGGPAARRRLKRPWRPFRQGQLPDPGGSSASGDRPGRPIGRRKKQTRTPPIRGSGALGKFLPQACLPGPRGSYTWSVRQVFWLLDLPRRDRLPGRLEASAQWRRLFFLEPVAARPHLQRRARSRFSRDSLSPSTRGSCRTCFFIARPARAIKRKIGRGAIVLPPPGPGRPKAEGLFSRASRPRRGRC
jgi:hypothetical protein